MARVIRGVGVDATVPRELLDASAQARALIADAEREADAIREAARDAGSMEGRAEAAATLAAAVEARATLLASSKPELVTLSLAIARRVIGEAVEASAELVSTLVDETLARAGADPRLRVRVCPADVATAEALSVGRAAALHVIVDASLGPGDCIVEGEVGTVDARIDTRLESLGAALRAVLDGER